MSETSEQSLVWHKVAELDELPEGRVKTVTVADRSFCLTHHDGQYGLLDNRCPHQGGPLGEGTIENGLLRCPWHGWDYCPLDGSSPAGFDDGVPSLPLEVRDDGLYAGLTPEESTTDTVSDLLARTLVSWGVTHVLGMVGHSNLGLAEALRRREADGELTFIGVRHEGAAALAASAYGKLTGRPAACLTIAGPGATNLLTGLWDAKVDRAPVIALTGQVQTQVFGPGAFQEIDLSSAFEAVTSYSHTVLPGSRHAELVNLAVKTAIVERNVAHLIVPDDVQTIPAPEGAQAGKPEGRVAPPAIAPPRESLDEAVRRIAAARRPVFIVGHGARDAMDQVQQLAEGLRAPVLTTFKAKGQIADDHPCGGGVLGRSGTPVASWLMNEADLLVVMGASFSNHTGITDHKPLIQVDFDRMALGRFHAVDVPVWGEIGRTCEELLAAMERLGDRAAAEDQRPDVAARWRLWHAEKARRVAEDDRGRGVSSAAVFDALNRTIPEDAIIAVDVGNHAYSFGRYFECKRQKVLMSGYLGSIGFGYPAAIGAWLASRRPDGALAGRKVLAVTGDGGFGQYPMEVTTAVKYGMDITHVLLDNGELGKISKEQRAGEWPVWQTDLVNPDFAAFVESCGGLGLGVTERGELEAALQRAVEHPGPATVAINTDAELV